MDTSSPTVGNTPPGPAGPRPRWDTHARLLHAAPVVVIALYGALWIALHAGGGRGSAHILWQSLALAETVLALLLRASKPAGALAGILAMYLLTDLDPLLLPAVLFALLTVATIRGHRTVAIATAAAVAVLTATPYIHGDAATLTWHILPRLAAAGAAAAAGLDLRVRQNRQTVNPAGEPEPRGTWTGSGRPGSRT